MRSYTNGNNEIVEVTEEHLSVSVKIKKELQKSSPSSRCSWGLHKNMMEREGFLDSDTNESYRKMIVNHQNSLGDFIDKGEYQSIVKGEKLASIQEAVGDIYFAKREAQLENNKLNRLKRNLTLYGVIAEQVHDAMVNDLNQIIPSYAKETFQEKYGSEMIVVITDWHIGALVHDVKNNSYNYNIAKKRIEKLFAKTVNIALMNGIETIHVLNNGDMTEHVSMRKVNQSFEVEFNFSQQIVKAYELIRNFVVNLSEQFNVVYRGISGNHDRMNGDKGDNIDGDSTIAVINYMLKDFIKTKEVKKIKYIECDDINYSTSFSINGINVKAVHGDYEKGSKILATHSDVDNISYNIIIMGHLHHHHVREVGQNKYEVHVGSLQGANNYAKKGKFLSNASQSLILISNDGEIDIVRIDLQNA